jgi:hypothetical protein
MGHVKPLYFFVRKPLLWTGKADLNRGSATLICKKKTQFAQELMLIAALKLESLGRNPSPTCTVPEQGIS